VQGETGTGVGEEVDARSMKCGGCAVESDIFGTDASGEGDPEPVDGVDGRGVSCNAQRGPGVTEMAQGRSAALPQLPGSRGEIDRATPAHSIAEGVAAESVSSNRLLLTRPEKPKPDCKGEKKSELRELKLPRDTGAIGLGSRLPTPPQLELPFAGVTSRPAGPTWAPRP